MDMMRIVVWLIKAGLLGFGSLLALFVIFGLVRGHDVLASLSALALDRLPVQLGVEQVFPEPESLLVIWRGDIQDRDLDESSGLLASVQHPGVLWSVNDSGNAATLFALGTDGRALAQFPVAAPMQDWEALAGYQRDERSYLVIADVGDNLRWRRSVQLHVLAEPSDLTSSTTLIPTRSIEVTYPDGPRDCEAVAVAEDGSVAYLLSKRRVPNELYAVDLGVGDVVEARLVDTLASLPRPTEQDDREHDSVRFMHAPTGMSLRGSDLLVATYRHAYIYDLDNLQGVPLRLRLPAVIAREAITFGVAPNTAYTTRERNDASVADVYEINWSRQLVRAASAAGTANER
ncbi:MAG: hypothetical protein AAF513_20800 [Pseudomonadota bacterium]